jgi:hypothetical protein
MKGQKRSVLGGESLFITTATVGPSGGWIDVSASLPGYLAVVDLVEGSDPEVDARRRRAFLSWASGQGKLVQSRNPDDLIGHLFANMAGNRA